jgi:general secretion pathway protein K
LMGYATSRMQQRLALAEDAKEVLHELAKVNAKLNELTYLLGTQRITAAGVSKGSNKVGLAREGGRWLQPLSGDELRADGYVYEVSGVKFSIQNEAGLISVNTPTQYWLKRWLSEHGYGVSEQNRLTATLADYADADNWRRPGGKEVSDEGIGNYLLQSCDELWRIEAWAALLEKYPYFLDHCSLSRLPKININALPDGLWRVLWPKTAVKVAEARSSDQWIKLDNELLRFAPGLLTLSSDLYTRLGGRSFIIKVWGEGASLSVRVEINDGQMNSYTVRARR